MGSSLALRSRPVEATHFDADLLSGVNLSGFEDVHTQKLLEAQHILRRGGLASYKPLLPLLLSLNGDPFTLERLDKRSPGYFPFETFYRTRVPRRTLFKTARQVAKSTSIAARGILHSVCCPYFKTLYVTPLYEMIRRFSQNYMRPFIETSPVRRLFTGSEVVQSVLQRSFVNRSTMLFSFAFQDCNRTRGISAHKNCLVGSTPVETADGLVPIAHVAVGDRVVSADKDGTIGEDVVTEKIYQGIQPVYAVTFADGTVLRCTDGERFRRAADGGWIYLRDLFSRRPQTAGRGPAVDLIPGATALGLFARRRHDQPIEQDGVLSDQVFPRHATGCVLSAESGVYGSVRDHAARGVEERRVGQRLDRVHDGLQPRLRRDRRDGPPPRQKARQRRLAVSPGLGGRGLLADGRRSASTGHDPVFNRRVHACGSPAAGGAIAADGVKVGQTPAGDGARTRSLRDPAFSGRLSNAIDARRDVRAQNTAVQTGPTQAAGAVQRLRGEFSREAGSGESRSTGVSEACVLLDPAAAIDSRVRAAQTCVAVTIASVAFAGYAAVWDINTAREHAFFANGILVHNSYDEIQDLDKDFLPIIRETMSGSPYGIIEEMAGTPKGLENTIEGVWQQSSQAEWVMKCQRCGYWNVPSLSHDIDELIGPYADDLSFENPGVVCAKCRQPRSIFPHLGRWVHAYPERRWDFAGYHIPQLIMPMHYADPEKWGILLGKREGRGNTPMNVFFNEVLGESYDVGSRIITLTDLKQACVLPWSNTLSEVRQKVDLSSYIARVLACDWGGGGEDGLSYTTYAVLGMLPDGKIDVIFGYRSLTPHDHVREARLAIGLANVFQCQAIAHDYTGAGATRETIVVQAGYPLERIIPVAYQRATAISRPMQYKQPTKQNPRAHYQADKTRSLQLTCNQIKFGWVRFFRWDYIDAEDTGLIYDFLALVDEKVDSRTGKDIYTIVRDPNMRDDFAQSVNIGCCTLWQMTDKWPDLAGIAHLRVPDELLMAIDPPGKEPLLGLM